MKGHGTCGFGGASKNLSMGCVDQQTRGALHGLEGGLAWDGEACTHCNACREHCPNEAISFSKEGTFKVFYHNCKLCQHCVLICPQKAHHDRRAAATGTSSAAWRSPRARC